MMVALHGTATLTLQAEDHARVVRPTPHGAATVAAAIGATRAGTMDLNAACTGFLAALSLAVGQVESGRARTVLVIGADAMSRVLDYDDRVTAGIFGDGAGAVVVRAVQGDSQVGPFVLEADGAAGDAIVTPWPAGPVRMEGQRTFRRAVARSSMSRCAAPRCRR
jgi:3-oxoacyl-[acyl-carrier-protein] synthase-3